MWTISTCLVFLYLLDTSRQQARFSLILMSRIFDVSHSSDAQFYEFLALLYHFCYVHDVCRTELSINKTRDGGGGCGGGARDQGAPGAGA
jgi:hypothetical protein